MNRDLLVPAIILTPKSPRLESVYWRVQIGPLEGYFGFLAKIDGNHGEIMVNIVWVVMYACQRSLWAQNRHDLREFFDGSKLASLEGHFGFLAKNDGNHGEIIGNIVWSVFYACPRSFWAQNRRDFKAFSDGFKLAPWRAILCFWLKTMEIMAKS